MAKINKHIEIVTSTKSTLSSMNRRSRQAVQAVLARHYVRVGITIVNDLEDLEALVELKPDVVFLGMKFIPLEPAQGLHDANKIWISQYLDEHDIVYTGSGQVAHELEFHKPLAKQRALDAGLKTSPFHIIKQNQPQIPKNLPLIFPVFIKPTNRGGGDGIDSASVSYNFDQLQLKVQSIATHLQADSLVEEYLSGREFSVAILKAEHSDKVLVMPIELVAAINDRGDRILSSEVKSSNAEQVLKVTDEFIKHKVSLLALNVFYALGARDYGRIDIRLDKYGTPHFLEANLIPSLISGYGSFPKACELNIKLDYETMILTIVRLAFRRYLNVHEHSSEPFAQNKLATR